MTSFLRSLYDQLLIDGPISVERYMALCLAHYYGKSDPLGAEGDFTTAPEISQMFGELIGLWMAEVWQLSGAPKKIYWVELGPGRGTLTADALRAAKLLPAFIDALEIHLVETSPALRHKQAQTLAATGKAPVWHDTLDSLPKDAPLFVIANEFFDALPIQQYVTQQGTWRQRCIGLDEADQRLRFGLFPTEGLTLPLPPQENALLEVPMAGMTLMGQLAQRITSQNGVALVIDYGYAGPCYGDTFQALYRHAYVDVLHQPGEADLTTHVDFQYLADASVKAGASIHGLSSQGDFLRQLGIELRAAKLMAVAPEEAPAIQAALQRLTGKNPDEMGELFKVMAISSSASLNLPGLIRCEGKQLVNT